MLSAQTCSLSSVVSIPRVLLLLLGLLIVLFIPYRGQIKQKWEDSGSIRDWLPIAGSQHGASYDLASETLSILKRHSPGASGSSDPIEEVKDAHAERWPAENQTNLVDILDIKPKQILAMMEAHNGFIKDINDKMPKYFAAKRAPPRGIVTVGGSSYFPPLMVSLRLLRRTGTSLPVEVFVPEEEYEPDLCEQIMPTLNAFCRTFPNTTSKISHYQYKIFAILLSSFSDVLWLDADNFPLHDAAPLFTSDPFRETGLVTWPDLWQTSISPAYYLIASRAPTPVSARASTESGQLLVSKAKHWKTLLVAAYYNYYGPGYYYPLLCQGGAGCGDKETFLPAAEAVGLPFYDVKAQPHPVGHYKFNIKPERGIYNFALIQNNPSSDYEVTSKLNKAARAARDEHRSGRLEHTDEADEENANSYENVPPFFLHMSTPKWDAHHVFDHVGKYDFTLDERRQPAPAYRDPPETADRIKGVERMVWEETRWVACNLEDTMGYWEGKRGQICQRLEEYFRDVLDTGKGAELGLAAELVPAPMAHDQVAD